MGNTSSTDRERTIRRCVALPASEQEDLASAMIEGSVAITPNCADEFASRDVSVRLNASKRTRHVNFRRLILAVHPDKNKGCEDVAAAAFDVITRSFKHARPLPSACRQRDTFLEMKEELSKASDPTTAERVLAKLVKRREGESGDLRTAYHARTGREQMVIWATVRAILANVRRPGGTWNARF
eukprot:jgi/Mesvir1/23344/Mv21039-RA.1